MANVVSMREPAALTEILTIVRSALRDAINAPTDRASLDVVGDALVAVAAIAKSEVAHA
ncbi:hypothetical protein [Cupriavidus numazuensis]|uniref:Uncharacterized protein n=1 Tax=Cupriavidus numazuensis TaxID=221992 RepID=A0ABM8TT11_9BURK|nr:hypothetical protein [Cupriavidus numazuensis]CAG2159548.1 hypothetical protein LMG26411_06785 [Cupriavidus numazuensis]